MRRLINSVVHPRLFRRRAFRPNPQSPSLFLLRCAMAEAFNLTLRLDAEQLHIVLAQLEGVAYDMERTP